MLITLILRVAILKCLVFVNLEVFKMMQSMKNHDDVLNEIEIVITIDRNKAGKQYRKKKRICKDTHTKETWWRSNKGIMKNIDPDVCLSNFHPILGTFSINM